MQQMRIDLDDLSSITSKLGKSIDVSSLKVSPQLISAAPENVKAALDKYLGWTFVVFLLPIDDEVLWSWHKIADQRYLFANYILERTSSDLQSHLRSLEVETIDVAREFAGTVSLVELGVQAGLGSRGVNNLLLHPTYGAWLQLHAILINGDVDRAQSKAVDVCIDCYACVEACPASAISIEQFYPRRCSVLVAAPWMPKSKAIALTSNSYIECAECIRQCPIGNAAEGILAWKMR
jgi:ferredoxin